MNYVGGGELGSLNTKLTNTVSTVLSLSRLVQLLAKSSKISSWHVSRRSHSRVRMWQASFSESALQQRQVSSCHELCWHILLAVLEKLQNDLLAHGCRRVGDLLNAWNRAVTSIWSDSKIWSFRRRFSFEYTIEVCWCRSVRKGKWNRTVAFMQNKMFCLWVTVHILFL